MLLKIDWTRNPAKSSEFQIGPDTESPLPNLRFDRRIYYIVYTGSWLHGCGRAWRAAQPARPAACAYDVAELCTAQKGATPRLHVTSIAAGDATPRTFAAGGALQSAMMIDDELLT